MFLISFKTCMLFLGFSSERSIRKQLEKEPEERYDIFFWLSCKHQRAKNLPDALEDKVRDKDTDIPLTYLCRYVTVFYPCYSHSFYTVNTNKQAQISFLLYEEIRCSLNFYFSKITQRPQLTISGVSKEATAVKRNPIQAIFISLNVGIGFCVPTARLNLSMTASNPHIALQCVICINNFQ